MKRKDETSSGILVECEMQVRRRTSCNILLHGKGNCCFPSSHAMRSKNPWCLPDSEDELKATAHSIASSSLPPHLLLLPLYPEELAHIQVQDEYALLLAKTSRSL